MLRTFFGGHVWNSWEGYAMMQWYYLPRCCKILWRADQRTKLCSSAFWLVAWWKKVKQAEAKTVLNPFHSHAFWIMPPSSYNLSFWRKDFYPFQHQAASFQIKRVKVKGFMATHQILPHWLLLITLTMPGVHRFGWWVAWVSLPIRLGCIQSTFAALQWTHAVAHATSGSRTPVSGSRTPVSGTRTLLTFSIKTLLYGLISCSSPDPAMVFLEALLW